MDNLGGQIIAIAILPFILIILIIMLGFVRTALKANATKHWPTVTGEIVSSRVTSHRSRSSNGSHGTVYKPAITYSYSADGHHYQSKHLNFGAIAGVSTSGWAEGIVAKYPPGSSVQVFYNPSKPAEAVLEHSGAGGNIAVVIALSGVEVILLILVVLNLTGHFS